MTRKEFDELFETVTSNGWLTREEGWLLVSSADQTEGSIVEVGSYQGRSAKLLASLKDEFGNPRLLKCVDPWDDRFHSDLKGEEIYQRFCANVPFPNVLHYRMRVEDWHPAPAGFVYLDGDHTYEGTVTQCRKALACQPQMIAAHDVSNSGGGMEVARAAYEILGGLTNLVETLAVWDLR